MWGLGFRSVWGLGFADLGMSSGYKGLALWTSRNRQRQSTEAFVDHTHTHLFEAIAAHHLSSAHRFQ